MPGGQKGLSLVGEPMAYATVATFIITLLLIGRGCGDFLQNDPSPMEEHETACEQAWSDNEAGKADEEAQMLLATSFCQQHNQVAVAEAQMEQQQELQEAQTP